jgi:hypothetical protein
MQHSPHAAPTSSVSVSTPVAQPIALLVAALPHLFCPTLSQPSATDQETGRARGFAHVEFEDADAAGKAVELNGQLDLGGRTLKVDSSTGRGGGTPGARSNAGASDGTTIFVKGFDTSGGWRAAAGHHSFSLGSHGLILSSGFCGVS